MTRDERLVELMPKCDPIPNDESWQTLRKPSSIGDPEWGMYVTPDDPLRDTPEKARAYYTMLFETFHIYPRQAAKASSADLSAAAIVLHA